MYKHWKIEYQTSRANSSNVRPDFFYKLIYEKLLKLNGFRGRNKNKIKDEESVSRSNKSKFSLRIQVKFIYFR